MKTVECVACGQDVRVPEKLVGGRGECPLCGARFAVPDESAEPDRELGPEADAAPSPWWRLAPPHLAWPLGDPAARRCVACQRNHFALPGPCPDCGGATAGLDVGAVASGDDGALQEAFADFQHHEKFLSHAVTAIWAVAAALALLLLVAMMRNRNLVVNLLFFALFAAPIVAGAAWLQARAAGLIGARFARRHPADRAAPRARGLERARDQVVEPFLDRHGVVEGMPIRAPEEELGLLRQLLAREDVALPADRVRPFLAACALRRDFDRFRWDLDGQPGVDRAPMVAYAALVPDESGDPARLPYLRQVLADAGRDADEGHVAAVLRDVRRERKLKSFAADLKERRPAPATVSGPVLGTTPIGPGVPIARVDGMAARNFEPLLALIHRARGDAVQEAARAGEPGVDLILERPGERVVLQGQLAHEPVGPRAVQRAVAAQHYYRCRRAIVATNHHFAPDAAALAAAEGVELIDRRGLIALLDAFNRTPARDDPRLAPLLAPDPAGVG